MQETCRLFRVDAFTTELFAGNPAAICFQEAETAQTLSSKGLQAIAAEMNLPATCFVNAVQRDQNFDTAHSFSVRWFTPVTELPLCGHGTLATAAAIFQGNHHQTLQFETPKGILSVQRLLEDTNGHPLMQLTLPSSKCSKTLPSGLNLDPRTLKIVVGNLPIRDIVYCESVKIALVVLGSEVTRQQLENLQPDLQSMLSTLSKTHLNGISVTCQGDAQPYHFLSRYFEPWQGIAEDAVTGAAHTVLGPYWAAQLNMFGQSIQARQCSKRGGDLQVTFHKGSKQLLLATCAVVIGSGHLNLAHIVESGREVAESEGQG